VRRFAPLVRERGRVLDLACGRGRHATLLSELGHFVVALDRDRAALAALRDTGVAALCADVERHGWPFAPGVFDGIVVTNYLHRPLFPALIAALAPSGVLIYETFAIGNERYGRPSNPAFLLRPGELSAQFNALHIVAFEQGRIDMPGPAVVQRMCAVQTSDSGGKTAPSTPFEPFSLG
jgi:SAM-dependent methyltransferase